VGIDSDVATATVKAVLSAASTAAGPWFPEKGAEAVSGDRLEDGIRQ
jgi:hypothetical protein